MTEMQIGEQLFSKLDHIGLIVRDLDDVVKYLQRLGMGPFRRYISPGPVEREVYGVSIGPEHHMGELQLTWMGPVVLEVLKPLPIPGRSPTLEYLDTKGVGINHLCFSVDDVEKETAKLEKKGFKCILRVKFRGSGGCTYLDTSDVLGFMTELVQWPPGYPKVE
ncbi:VOC family protein [Chloroflexota bacterium]